MNTCKINQQGKKEIELKIKKPLESMAVELEKNGSLGIAQPMLELVFETLLNIDKRWENIK